MYQTILTSLNNRIFTITINRPDKLNALNKTVISELSEAIDELISNKLIGAAIITGAGPKSFVAGADISEFAGLDGKAGEALALRGQTAVFSKIENCPKPVVAAINGFALGGGCELAMACHFRLAADTARFGQPEVNLGLVPGYGGTQRLTQLVGKGRAMEWMMTGGLIDAATALQSGLVNHVVPAADLMTKTTEIVSTILTKAPRAISEVIRLTNLAALGDPNGLAAEAQAFGALFETADAKEGAAAFLEKRKPAFKGE